MKHKQFESWILDDTPLNDQQLEKLNSHLARCKKCQILSSRWTLSKKLIMQSIYQKPESGFSQRWQITAIRKAHVAKIRRYRMSVFGLIMLAFLSSIIYLLASGSFLRLFANGFTTLSEFAVRLTNGLSGLGYWLSHLPIAVPITAGFIFFGLINSFVMVGIFFLWNLKQRKFQSNEIQLD